MKLPQSKNNNVVVQELKNELLIYNLATNQAFALNETLAIVYQNCDGQTTFAELKKKHRKLTDDVILLALDELSRENLLAEKFDGGLSRRELLNRAKWAMVALPIMTGIIAPLAAHAASGCVANGGTCSLSNPGACCSTRCTVTSSGTVCAPLSCVADGGSCSLSNPGACCSTRCASTSNGTVCAPLSCTANGQPCSLSNPGACCSTRCTSTSNGTVCAPLN